MGGVVGQAGGVQVVADAFAVGAGETIKQAAGAVGNEVQRGQRQRGQGAEEEENKGAHGDGVRDGLERFGQYCNGKGGGQANGGKAT